MAGRVEIEASGMGGQAELRMEKSCLVAASISAIQPQALLRGKDEGIMFSDVSHRVAQWLSLTQSREDEKQRKQKSHDFLVYSPSELRRNANRGQPWRPTPPRKSSRMNHNSKADITESL